MAELNGPRFGPKQGRARHLVVLLHGVGADGHDLIDLAPGWAAALPEAAFVSPDAPDRYDGSAIGRQWFSLSDRSRPAMAEAATAAAGPLARFVAAELARLDLGPDAYALVGFSQGAMMALQVGLRHLPPPRAVVAYSGILLDETGFSAQPPPVLLVHGEDDAVVPAEATRVAERVLRAAGVVVEADISPRLGHGIDAAGLSRGGLWLQRYVTGG